MICPSCFKPTTEPIRCPNCKEQRDGIYLPIGTYLRGGEYLVGKVLGKPGGFGITYLAWNAQLDVKVAIKEYLPLQIAGRSKTGISVSVHAEEYQPDFDFGLDRFLEEAKTLAQFRHPNIVRVLNFFRENGTAYMVMDYLEGESLAEYLARVGKLTGPDAVALFSPILDGLGHIHARNYLHRDIKPANIYLTHEGQAILLDFGSARQSIRERSQSLTAIVTPGFAPWEQYHKRGKQGPWTDVYACAATLYFMISGIVPPDGTDRLVDDDIVALSDLAPGLNKCFADAIMQGLTVNPEERQQKAIDLFPTIMDKPSSNAVLRFQSLPFENRRKEDSLGSNVDSHILTGTSDDNDMRGKHRDHKSLDPAIGSWREDNVLIRKKSGLIYFGEDDDFVKGECTACQRVLKIPWRLVWFSQGKLELNEPNGIKCPCGIIYELLEGIAKPENLKVNTSKKIIPIQEQNNAIEVSQLVKIFGDYSVFHSDRKGSNGLVQWIKSPCDGVVDFVWADLEKHINAGEVAVILSDVSRSKRYQIAFDKKVWVKPKSVKIRIGDNVTINKALFCASTKKPMKEGEIRWFNPFK